MRKKGRQCRPPAALLRARARPPELTPAPALACPPSCVSLPDPTADGQLVYTDNADRTSSFFEVVGFNTSAEYLSKLFERVPAGCVPPSPCP